MRRVRKLSASTDALPSTRASRQRLSLPSPLRAARGDNCRAPERLETGSSGDSYGGNFWNVWIFLIFWNVWNFWKSLDVLDLLETFGILPFFTKKAP